MKIGLSIIGSDYIPEIPLSDLPYAIGGLLIVLGAVIMIKGLMERRKERRESN